MPVANLQKLATIVQRAQCRVLTPDQSKWVELEVFVRYGMVAQLGLKRLEETVDRIVFGRPAQPRPVQSPARR